MDSNSNKGMLLWMVRGWLLLILLNGVSGCAPPASSVLTAPSPSSTVLPLLTPTGRPSPLPSPTFTPSPTPTSITLAFTPVPAEPPEAMALQRFDAALLWVKRNGVWLQENAPFSIAHAYSYDPIHGRLAFSPFFLTEEAATWGRAVSDLWVYDYATQTTERWLSERVAGAAWAPVPAADGAVYLAVAVLNPRGCRCSNLCYDLRLYKARDELVQTIPAASAHFSWSADGKAIVYYGNLCESESVYIAWVNSTRRVWVGSTLIQSLNAYPVYDPQIGMVFYPYRGLTWARDDGSESFPIFNENAELVSLSSPTMLLWSGTHRMLIAGQEAGLDTPGGVLMFKLSADYRTVLHSTVLRSDGLVLLGWDTPDEVLLLYDAVAQRLVFYALQQAEP